MVTEAKGVQDVLSGQADLSADYSKQVLAIARKTADILNQSREEITAWVEKGVETATREATKKASATKTSA